ncbi:MAG TPA: cytochrome P450 [Actinospica sp.]|nr:cytochrome P450 [Actinospica sp.]
MEAEEVIGALLRPEGRADPYPVFAAARELGPLSRLKEVPLYLCTGYGEINAVLRDPAFGKDQYEDWLPEVRAQLAAEGAMESVARSILSTNPPDHRRVRSLISSAFTQRRIAALEPAIERITDQLLDEIAERGAGGVPVDFMELFAYRLPVTVICELLGIPERDRGRIPPLGQDLTAVLELMETFDGLGPADAAAAELREFFGELSEQRRREPQEDLISALVQVNDAHDGRLSDIELIVNLILLLVAGFETTTNLLGNGLQLGFEHPEVLARVRAGEIPVSDFVEEVLRYDSPVQITSRVALTGEARVGEVPIPKGAQVMMFFGAAHRDPARFRDPDEFDPLRPDNVPLSFGAGIHYCLGQGLARLEAQVAFSRLFARFPELKPAAEPTRRDRLVLRGYQTLPVMLG